MGKGRPCPHGSTKCANCGGPHGARADACAAKRMTRQLTRGRKTPPPPRKVRGAKALEAPEHEAPGAQEGGEAGEVEAEGRVAPSPEKMEE